MKVMTGLLAIVLLVGLTAINLSAEEFVKGKHYIEINGELSKNPQVTEYFSFYCPHCYRQEPFMEEVKSMLPETKSFVKTHVDSMPGRDKQLEHALSRALVTAQLLKVEEKIVADIFSSIHEAGSPINSEDDIKKLFQQRGVDGVTFDKTFNSFRVKTAVKKMQKSTNAMRQQGITSVPTLLINNKFVPQTRQLTSMKEYKALIAFLLTKTS